MMIKYTEGVCEDGAAILKNGKPMTISELLEDLNFYYDVAVTMTEHINGKAKYLRKENESTPT